MIKARYQFLNITRHEYELNIEHEENMKNQNIILMNFFILKVQLYYVDFLIKIMVEDDGVNIFDVCDWAIFKYSQTFKDELKEI